MILQKIAIPLIAITLAGLFGPAECKPASSPVETELHDELNEILNSRAQAIITGADPEPALDCYDTTAKLGRWALSHEQAKLNYMQLWAQKRGVSITEAKPSLQIPWSRIYNNTAELTVHQTLQLGYVYPDDPTVNRFGIGTRHWMKMVRKDGRWLILQDFYTDGLGDNILKSNPTPADGSVTVEPVMESAAAQDFPPGIYDREGAVRYADKYAGLAWGAGNNHDYNTHYRDMNDKGGDCTNFISQCIGDEEGGKLPMFGAWFYDRKSNSGSLAWVRAEAFGDWLLYSGRGQRVERGTFPELHQPSEKFPRGAVRELQKGDVIGYGERGYSRHFSIMVGSDSKGYPLVNSHNVDRYHCPWDLGFDKSTIFHLYKIKDN